MLLTDVVDKETMVNAYVTRERIGTHRELRPDNSVRRPYDERCVSHDEKKKKRTKL